MSADRGQIFKLLETGDNFLKYARPGREERAAAKARKRFDKALALAAGDLEMTKQVSLRLDDLERRDAGDAGDPGASGTEGAEDGSDDRDEGVLTHDLPAHASERVPPGQRLVHRWPVLHVGMAQRFHPRTWRFSVSGACATEVDLSYDEVKALPTVEMRSDFHCVTGWSKLDNLWMGVQAGTILAMAAPAPDATHVLVHAQGSYSANLPLEVLLEDQCVLAWSHNWADLSVRHGWPLRLVAPSLYGWKSVKWVRSFELMTEDRRGFWEERGYHNLGDPWREERFSYQ